MTIPTLDELREMQVSEIHAMLVDLAQSNAFQHIELNNLRHWREERGALLKQTGRLHRQLAAVCDELHRMHERWGDGQQ